MIIIQLQYTKIKLTGYLNNILLIKTYQEQVGGASEKLFPIEDDNTIKLYQRQVRRYSETSNLMVQ